MMKMEKIFTAKVSLAVMVLIIIASLVYKNITFERKMQEIRNLAKQENLRIKTNQNNSSYQYGSKITGTTKTGINYEDMKDQPVPDPNVEKMFNNLLVQNLGRKTVVVFWANWNLSSQRILDEIDKVHRSSSTNSTEIKVISIDVSENETSNYLTQKAFPFVSIKDAGGVLMKKYQIDAIPSIVFINEAQNNSLTIKGHLNSDEIINHLNNLK